MRHLKYLLFALLIVGIQSCTTKVSNTPLSSNSLPLEAPYGGLKGEIDSVVSKSYLVVDGVKSNTPRENKIMVYDKNGYAISSTYQFLGDNDKVLHSTKNVTLRDENSRIVGLEQNIAGSRVIMELDKTEGDMSYFKIKDLEDFKDLVGELTVQERDSLESVTLIQITDRDEYTMTIKVGGMKGGMNNTIRFDDIGRAVYSSSNFSPSVSIEKTSEYDEKGLLYHVHTHTQTKFVGDSVVDKSSDTYYQNYTFETEAPRNWISREEVDDKGKSIRVEEQKIYYRNRK